MTDETLKKIIFGSGFVLFLTLLAGWALWVYEVFVDIDSEIQQAWATILIPLGVLMTITFVVSLAAYIDDDKTNQTTEEDTP